jgi:glycosyltransferase involved in cell wall biosynthesis
MSRPRVSIVIPVYRQESYLEATFASIFAQSHSDFQVIAVDDGSPDGSLRVLESMRDERLIVIAKENGGQASAVNAGLSRATGDYVKIMDGDDLLSPRHLEAQIAALAGTHDAVASSRWTYFVDDPASSSLFPEITDRDYEDPFEWIVDTLRDSRGMFAVWQWLIPRELLHRVGFWDERLGLEADFEFTVRLLLAARSIRFAGDAVLYYRKGIASQSHFRSRAALSSALLATELATERLVKHRDTPEVRRLAADRLQQVAFLTYPSQPDLCERAEAGAAKFGGSDLRLPGGRIGRSLGRFLSWKQVRALQEYSRSLGWRHVLRVRERRRLRSLRQGGEG